MYNELRQYIRRGKKIVGVMYSGVNENDAVVGFGWSLCSGNHGDRFDKEKCMNIAEGRAYYNYRDNYVIDNIPVSIQKEMPKFVKRMAIYYKDNEFDDFVNDLFGEFLYDDYSDDYRNHPYEGPDVYNETDDF